MSFKKFTALFFTFCCFCFPTTIFLGSINFAITNNIQTTSIFDVNLQNTSNTYTNKTLNFNPEYTNSLLTSLQVKHGKLNPSFNPKRSSYTLRVDCSVKNLKITTTQNQNTQVEISDTTLTVGTQKDIFINVSSPSQPTNVYTIKVTVLRHNWDNWVTTVEPTYKQEGKKQRTCLICGEIETQVLDKLDPPIIPETPTTPNSPTRESKPNDLVLDIITLVIIIGLVAGSVIFYFVKQKKKKLPKTKK